MAQIRTGVRSHFRKATYKTITRKNSSKKSVRVKGSFVSSYRRKK